MAESYDINNRPHFPKRAVITGGMPYGNKNLHFGHIAGVFVPADFFARLLRDRIGQKNVLFISGTDCYGSPIAEGYRKKVEEEGYEGTILDYVNQNHNLQKSALNAYNISLDFYGGSALEPAAKIHEEMADSIMHRLYERGKLSKLSTKQFYDTEAQTFLNGRQVKGPSRAVSQRKLTQKNVTWAISSTQRSSLLLFHSLPALLLSFVLHQAGILTCHNTRSS